MSDEREYKPDPEVVADLQLRASTQHDSTRTGSANYAWSEPGVVTSWPCRSGCGRMVGVTEDAVEHKAMFDRILKARMEPPLDRARIVFCEDCRAKGRKISADQNRKQVDKLAEIIAELKKGASGERERELLEKCRALGHPDVDGLVQALREKAVKPSGKRTRMGAL